MVLNWVRLAPNETNRGLFKNSFSNLGFLKISFSTFWLVEPKCTETDLKNLRLLKLILMSPSFLPLGANLNQFKGHPSIPVQITHLCSFMTF